MTAEILKSAAGPSLGPKAVRHTPKHPTCTENNVVICSCKSQFGRGPPCYNCCVEVSPPVYEENSECVIYSSKNSRINAPKLIGNDHGRHGHGAQERFYSLMPSMLIVPE